LISYNIESIGKGIEWISIKVNDLAKATEYLTSKNLLSENSGRVSTNRAEDFGLQIFLEE
jgi:hypothetical protein